MDRHRVTTVRDVLRDAAAGTLEDAWVYLRDVAEISLEDQCVVVGDIDEPHDFATSLGFPQEGLDTPSIEDCVAWASSQPEGASDDLFLYSFRYYWRFDAFPAHAWAPDPPAAEEIRHSLALEFYRLLGSERPGTKCRREGCTSGAIQHSVLCRVHHYEMIRNEPCTFRGDA